MQCRQGKAGHGEARRGPAGPDDAMQAGRGLAGHGGDWLDDAMQV